MYLVPGQNFAEHFGNSRIQILECLVVKYTVVMDQLLIEWWISGVLLLLLQMLDVNPRNLENTKV